MNKLRLLFTNQETHDATVETEVHPLHWKDRFGSNPLTSDLASVNNALV